MTDTKTDVTLEYAQEPAPSPRWRRWPAKAALAMSLAAPVCLVVSVTMYTLMEGMLRTLQLLLAWTSIYVGGAGLILAIVAMILNPRGKGEIAALAIAVVHAAMVLAVLTYVG